jgi:hypothetical protein
VFRNKNHSFLHHLVTPATSQKKTLHFIALNPMKKPTKKHASTCCNDGTNVAGHVSTTKTS